jgi:arabinan endo-1,5-alpha-L-arabinosidase
MKTHLALRPALASAFALTSFALACSSSSGTDDAEGGAAGTPSQGGATNVTGGTSATIQGGASQGLGGLGAGGALGSGGGNGGQSASSGGAASGGVVGNGGGTSGGSSNGTGGTATAGNTGKGGTSNGGTASGGSSASGAGGKAMGGASNGGTSANGGTTASGGASNGGSSSAGSANGGAANDRCDVGVYDSANPPKVLTLSGNLGTHDPSSIIESNGTYYLFQTGLGAKTSTNLLSWQAAAKPFNAPSWATTQVPGVSDLWAPDISYFGGQYHLYYSASTFGSNRSCIGQATRAALNSGSWADQGQVICSNVGTKDNWNAIDPSVIIDTSNNPWLVFGSFWSGIKIIQLTEAGARMGTTVTAIANRPSNGGALEGPFMVRRCGYYYLFTSWDTCCKGADSTYNIRVGRSTSVTGPFTDKAGTALTSGGGTLVAQGAGSWAGPGGQSVAVIGNKAYLVYHAYAKSNGAATLRIADLVWDSSGWPVAVGP